MVGNNAKKGRLSPLMALRLAAPSTWVASVIPALLGAAISFDSGSTIDGGMLLCLTAACVFMQAAVNTFNDYSDFMKGTDTLENSPDTSDAVLIYDRPKPQKVLVLGFAYLLCAAAAAVPAIINSGWKPLVIGCVGAAAVLLYSFGKIPLSYLPLGELCSGFVMGGLIPLAVSCVLSGSFQPSVLLRALPTMLGIALIMMTNNGCDIARDTAAGRRTFAVLLGPKHLAFAYRLLLLIWIVLPLPLLVTSENSCLIYLLSFLSISGHFTTQIHFQLTPELRSRAMAGIVSLNTMLGLSYIAALLF